MRGSHKTVNSHNSLICCGCWLIIIVVLMTPVHIWTLYVTIIRKIKQSNLKFTFGNVELVVCFRCIFYN